MSKQDLNEELNDELNENNPTDNATKNRALDKAKNFFLTSYNKLTDSHEKKKFEKALNNAFEECAETYTVLDLLESKKIFQKYTVYGIRNSTPNTILIRKDDPLFNKLTANMEMTASSDLACFRILEKDSFNTIDYKIQVNNEDFFIQCYAIKVKLMEREKTSIPSQNVTNIQQSIVVQGNNSAPINQIANVEEQLNKIEGDIKNCKGKLFSNNKREAEKLFGSFKDCVLSNKKNDSLFDKFLKSLKSLALDAAIVIAKQLIVQLGN